MDQEFKFIECPRDAMQGFSKFIATDKKIRYINQLLKVGFHTIDFGSFVSERYVPQMKDTEEVLERLEVVASNSGLLVIVVNRRGAQKAVEFEKIKYLGYPLSVSETFQRNNANMSIGASLILAEQIQELCLQKDKELVVYISMSFGNHYSDPYHTDLVMEMIKRLDDMGIGVVSLADTVGIATSDEINKLLSLAIGEFPRVEIGAHLHSTPEGVSEKLKAVYDSGCQRLDSALLGYGGCPMAEDDLTGNLATEKVISFFKNKGIRTGLDENEFEKALMLADDIFQLK